MLWGNEAKTLVSNIINSLVNKTGLNVYQDHQFLVSYHPAYDLHKRDNVGRIVVKYPDGFSGCKHFSAANDFLLCNNQSAIDWLPIEKNTDIEPLSNKPPF
jgi:uracil DNA glycosylase